jgi:hypothetical protein
LSQLVLLSLVATALFLAQAPGFRGEATTAAPARLGAASIASSAPVAFLSHDAAGRPIRFDPCRPIHFVVNPRGGSADAVADVRQAFRRLAEATGIELVDDGFTAETHRRVGRSRPSYQPERYGTGRWAPVLVTFTDVDHEPLLAGDVLAYGGASSYARGSSPAAYVTGEVMLDRDQRLVRPGFGPGLTRGNLLLHELGHVVGLDHLDVRASVMYPTISSSSPDGYAPVDLAGLAQVGRPAGCVNAAEPV